VTLSSGISIALRHRRELQPGTLRAVSDLADLVDRLPAGTVPPGRLVTPEGSEGPAYWLSDGPSRPGDWARLRARHASRGLWPLLLHGLDGEPDRPWAAGEVSPGDRPPGDLDADTLLASWWEGHLPIEADGSPADDEESELAPFGASWPGLAPAVASRVPNDAAVASIADQYAENLRSEYLGNDQTRLGLVAAERGSDALWGTGWDGPCNYFGTAGLSVVVRSWEARFGATVVGIGFATLELSVAAPPLTIDEALPVAAEHFAACPDNILQGRADSFHEYADLLVGENSWTFWWD
jgi:hypothetical protein